MKVFTLLSTTIFTLSLISACSPPDDSSNNTFSNQKQALDKAKAVEKINMDSKQHIDDTVKAAES